MMIPGPVRVILVRVHDSDKENDDLVQGPSYLDEAILSGHR